jgi:hypothetical protein
MKIPETKKEYEIMRKWKSVRRNGIGYGKKWDKELIDKQLRGLNG